MHGRLADNILLVVEEICAVDLIFGHNILLDTEFATLRSRCKRTQKSAINVDLECGVLISSTSYSGFWVTLVQLMAWAEDTCIGSALWPLLCFWHWAVYSLQVMRTYSRKLLEKSLIWLNISDGEDMLNCEFWDRKMHWHCEANGHIWAAYLSEGLCDEMFRYCEDNTYIIVIVLFG